MKFLATLGLVLILGGCSLVDSAQNYFNQKVQEAVEKGKQTAQEEINKQVDTTVDQAKQGAKDFVAGQINTARDKVTQTIDEKGQALVKDLTATPTPTSKIVPTKKPAPTSTTSGIKYGEFLYLQYSPQELGRAKSEKVFLFFSDEHNWALDKYFTVTEDLVKNNIVILQIDSTKNQTLKNQYKPDNGDEVIQVDASGKEIQRIQGEPYSTTPFLTTIDGKVK